MKKQTTEPLEDFSAALNLAREQFNQSYNDRYKLNDKYETYFKMSEALLVFLQLKTGYRVGDLLERTTGNAIQLIKSYPNGKPVLHPHLVLMEKKTEKRTKKERKVVIDAETEKMIVQHRAYLADAFAEKVNLLGAGALDELPLFYNPKTGKNLQRQWADNRLRGGERRKTQLGDALRKMTIGHRISTHSLRKTYAHRLYEHTGCNINYVSEALGHKSITTTKHYLNINDAKSISIHLDALK